ncbi:MAG: hypothetical protein WC554_07760 [Clostridia bacterium]
MKIVNRIIELQVEGIITEFALPKQIEIEKDVFVPDITPPVITIQLIEPYTEELQKAINTLFEAKKIQITFKNESDSTIQK